MNRKINHPVLFVLGVGLAIGALGDVTQSAHLHVASTANALIVAAFLVALYFLPTIVAHQRHHHQLGSIAVINTLAGWTFIGWVVALAMACSATTSPVTSSPPAPEGQAPLGW